MDQNTTQPVFTDEGDLFVPFIDYLAQGEMLETRRAWIVRSADVGASCSEPVLITEQEWGPVHLAIDRGASHPGRLYYLLTCARQDLYVAVSLDGGESFLGEVRVTDWSSDPLTEANGWAAERWPAGGDYHGLAPLPDGSFQVVWAASPDGIFRLGGTGRDASGRADLVAGHFALPGETAPRDRTWRPCPIASGWWRCSRSRPAGTSVSSSAEEEPGKQEFA